MHTYWLSSHAHYECRHTGACCSSRWPIPVEAVHVGPIDAALADRRLDTGGLPWLEPIALAPPEVAGVFGQTADGRCVFRQAHRCAVHTALGPGRLPAACLHFPRVCLIDDRGVFVTLSHYCPTAAAMLVAHAGPVSIVPGPPAISTGGIPEGLDARADLPPLFDERRLMSLDEYGAWERDAVAVLAEGADPDAAVARLWAGAGGGPLARTTRARFDEVRGAVPPTLQWPDSPHDTDRTWAALVARASIPVAPVVGRYLAARVFASWVAYQGRGLRAVVRGVEAALAVFRVEAVRQAGRSDRALDRTWLIDALRQADLLLVHYADPQALAHVWSRP